MKKLIILALIFALLLSLTACAEEGDKPKSAETRTETAAQTTANEPETTKAIETQAPDEVWGVGPESVNLLTTEETHPVYIRFPSLVAVRYYTGKVAYQTDETLVILDARNPDVTPEEAQSVDDVLTAYRDQTIGILSEYRNTFWRDFSFDVQKQEHLTVNGYEMCKYTGIHHCTWKGEEQSMFFTAYSAAVNGGKDYVYWMVLDESDDQSLNETVEYYADQMAKTLED